MKTKFFRTVKVSCAFGYLEIKKRMKVELFVGLVFRQNRSCSSQIRTLTAVTQSVWFCVHTVQDALLSFSLPERFSASPAVLSCIQMTLCLAASLSYTAESFLCSVFPRPVVGVNSQLPLSSWIAARLRDSGKGKPCQVQTANIKQAWQPPLLLQAWQWFKVLFHLRRWQAAKCMQIYFTYSQMELIEAACRCHGDYRLLEQLCELLPPLGSLYVCI